MGRGSYKWTTSSTKVTLLNDTSQTVTVKAGPDVSGGLDAETITVTFTPEFGSAGRDGDRHFDCNQRSYSRRRRRREMGLR